tara:strand:+ start:679 stop:1377 length:699 start_codon:yes stop_codon:yes gene_type:complete
MKTNFKVAKNLLSGIFILIFQTFSFAANFDVSLYGGFNNAAHSSVTFANTSVSYGIDNGKYSVNGWKGESFESPIYYGYRFSVNGLQNTDLEFALDFNHSKVKAKKLPGNLNRLEFTDGLNTLTLMAVYKFESVLAKSIELTPYVGVGLGIAYPHVDVEGTTESGGKTYDYQTTGSAYQLLSGVRYQVAESWKAFAEYRITYTPIKADLDGGGQLETNILNNQVSFGFIYSF